ncbi:hypothetical protein B0T24DRAFT_171119 [Lasiosphaeria ovina]|uniref:Tafazzin family protein n=1 Tax=Lasiosphaeria ovina TaxID=92902 RepID=A0AAE0NE33_9PEZI|nr:hypothetical protein B0T24DRAFT_171119 [Lasiosphaeria ovina]
MASHAPAPQSPSLPWRMSSAMVMGMTGVISRSLLYGLNSVETTGLSRFLDILNSRHDPETRQRGLLTVSNHVSVVDDPLIWGVLPLNHSFNPSNLRWTLGAHDICFSNKFFANFFTYGQVLPCHRLKHSAHGGLFQPSLAQAIRLLSSQPFSPASSSSSPPLEHHDIPDPFTVGAVTYTTNGSDSIPAPSVYTRNRNSWVHVFPEGLVHQHQARDLRYFKWGVARLILEAEPAPDVLPMFIDGTQNLMPEDRGFPRFLPRFGKRIRVAFGEVLDYEATFGDLRRRWEGLVRRSNEAAAAAAAAAATATARNDGKSNGSLFAGLWAKQDTTPASAATTSPATIQQRIMMLGELPDDLKYSKEAQEIRIEVARRMREAVLKVRKSLGDYPDADPTLGSADIWKAEDQVPAKKYKSRVDGSEINQN